MVRIRGINTVNDNGPLYVIDGVSTRNQDLSSLNPNDIESMQVLKDASSAAIYGAQAANGSTSIDPSDYSYPGNTYAPFSDTDWWDEIDRVAMIQNHQIGLAGGGEKGQYNLSANYFKQDGTVIDSYYQRYQVRANTTFNVRDWLRVGENMTYAFTKDNGLNASGAESNPYSWTYRASPFVRVTSKTRLPMPFAQRITTILTAVSSVTCGQRLTCIRA